MEKQIIGLLEKKFQQKSGRRTMGFSDVFLRQLIEDISKYSARLQAKIYSVINALDDYKPNIDFMETLQRAVYEAKVDDFRTSEDFILSQAWERGDSSAKLQKPPIFMWMMQNDEISVLHETEKHICFVPAGWQQDDFKLPGGIVPMQQRIAGSRALMSLLHVLVVPLQRIYNAACLPEDYDFDDARACGKAGIEKLLKGDKYLPGSWDFWMKNTSIKELGLKPKPTDMASGTPILKPDTLDLDYSFHVFPDNSVGYLHMHVFEKSLLTKNYQLMSPLINTPVSIIEDTEFNLSIDETMFEDGEEISDLKMKSDDTGLELLIQDLEREYDDKVADKNFLMDIEALMQDLSSSETESEDESDPEDVEEGLILLIAPKGSIWQLKMNNSTVTILRTLPGFVEVQNGGNLVYKMTNKEFLSLYYRIK